MTAYNPWAELGAHPEWAVEFRKLPRGQRGRWHDAIRVLILDSDQSQAARRSTLAHELIHAERGDRGCDDGWFGRRQERTCDQLASRRLIALHDLARALQWSTDEHEVADELHVDVAMLRSRIEHLHPAEKHYLRRFVGADEDA